MKKHGRENRQSDGSFTAQDWEQPRAVIHEWSMTLLSQYDQAGRRGAQVIAVTRGGEL